MRVVINGLTTLKPRTGIGQYTARLAAELQTLMPPGEVALYPPAHWRQLSKRFLQGNSTRPSGSPSPWKSKLKSMARRVLASHFRDYCRTYEPSLYHEPNFLPFAANVPTVITIHDLSVLLHPEWHPADRVREHTVKLERAARHAVAIITDTEQVRREVIRELAVTAAKVKTVHLGVSEAFAPSKSNKEYYLCVGTIEPRKNLLVAMRAYVALPDAVRTRYPLLLAGPWGWRSEAEHDFYDRVGRHQGIRHLGYVPDEDLPGLYQRAVALLYPSHYEGFGLPPLEANASGTQCICSQGTLAVREVMGPAAEYCDADDVDAWRQAMLTSLESKTVFNQSARFTWRRTALRTLQIYDDVSQPRLRQAA